MKLQFILKRFNELSLNHLYEILVLRSEVFIVEQNCPYQDVDGKDDRAVHVLGLFEGQVVAYARLFDAGAYFDTASIGRVLIRKDCRDKGWGHDLMRESVDAIDKVFGKSEITISAQHYLLRFYQTHGFIAVGEVYPEDDIPHIRMVRTSYHPEN